jgi:hypothetical protein
MGRHGGAMRFPAGRPAWTTLVALLAACGALGLACSDTVGPDEPFSLEFEAPVAPSIVSGDSLRDITGAAVPLRAVAYNLRGEPLTDAAITYIALDTSDAIVIDQETGHVVAAGPRRGSVRIVASAGSLQSAPITLEIVPPPARAVRSGTIDTLRYAFSNPNNTSGPLRVLVTRDSADAPVPRYLVRFRLDRLADTVVARLVDEGGRRSPLDPIGATAFDTTGADGIASRQIRLTPNASLRQPVDSIVVFADVQLRGAHVAGSPVRLTLFVRLAQ